MTKFRPICPVCRRGGYDQTTAPDGRPLFRCGRCGAEWTSGPTGDPYARPSVTTTYYWEVRGERHTGLISIERTFTDPARGLTEARRAAVVQSGDPNPRLLSIGLARLSRRSRQLPPRP